MVESVPCVVDAYVPVIHNFYGSWPLDCIVSHTNSVQILTFCFLRSHFNVIFPLTRRFPESFT